MSSFPFIKQLDAMDCGPTSLCMIAKYYGKTYTQQTLRERCYITREGVSMLGTSDAAESIGMRTMGVRISYEKLAEEAILPCIAHWKQNHFIVVYKIKNDFVYVSDPAHGLVKYTKEEFLEGWVSTRKDSEDQGICLLLEPTPDFYKNEDESLNKANFKFLFSYLRPYKKFLIQLFLGMLVGSLLQLIFPFLTQSIVDYGINNRDISFVTLVLIAQLALYVFKAAVELIRSWILLHISTRINISLISDFLIKLMKLPIGFFDTKMIGDIMQRIGDHTRIENFLTSSTLNILFSLINMIIFGIVLLIYDVRIFGIFFFGSILYFFWIYLFMKKRRDLDFKRFAQLSENQSNLFQLIMGMQEIKLNNCEKQKRWEWERIQAKLFRVNIKSLALSQNQQIGSMAINQIKNIFISFYAAKAVIDGDMTLGMMLAVQYIIGQLNSPIEQLIGFMQATQDAKISLERLGEIHKKDDEETFDEQKITILPEDKSLYINSLSFQYEGPHSESVLKDLNLVIPEKKVTAIVGASGSGKTTLIKLLMGFYKPTKGDIKVGNVDIWNISSRMWRGKIGAVMQDGFIFSDTIAKNIAISDEIIDKKRLMEAATIANVTEFVQTLPLGFNTKIGQEGHGLSQGQKQRILIARAAYSNPSYLIFDEATNALDANNERSIMEKLEGFFEGRTVIIVAHRLSTVKHADQILVLDKGKIAEIGNHEQLTELRGSYYTLVKNQLELGN